MSVPVAYDLMSCVLTNKMIHSPKDSQSSRQINGFQPKWFSCACGRK
jgi:hypothetical protein